MRRREFIALVGGAVVWPLAAEAQQGDRTRRIGFLSATAANPEMQGGVAAFQQSLQQLGWTDGRNVRFDTRLCARSEYFAV